MADSTRPALVVDDVHIHYRTFGGRRLNATSKWANLRRHVGAVDVVKAVRGVSFVAHHGESIGIIGHNGSGKSTLLRALAGSLPPTKGSIWTDGTASLLGVNAALIKDMTGERNVILGGLALGLSPAEVRARYDETVELAGIGEFMHLPMRAYSSGMSARLRFAISTASRPDILLIDEALATGDVDFRQRSRQRVDEIVEHAGTVLLVSHSMSTIRGMCDRVIWINKGLIEMDGPTDDVLDEYAERTGIPTARNLSSRRFDTDDDDDLPARKVRPGGAAAAAAAAETAEAPIEPAEPGTDPAPQPPSQQATTDSNASQSAL
ncbi:ABC transporter ATP-binding protein [Nocardioides marmorisolisilvae]|uniref:ABC transporter ATP-binding protein n=1 Tax=Nocardioides marmorisolisilvae TaxID=1542737 RepID=A0A3N0DIJ4_9ACTN|nr:ABC transporter ATP-binding protein [Nocardioides marmorisolisilvae]RNL75507.1 ABC transporter ATP-binding protein [Nocardioides marmorisolisilvae]